MQITHEELQNGVLSDENLTLALRTIRDTGLVTLEGVYEREWIADLQAAYDAQLERHIVAKGGMEGMNARAFGHNHIGMFLPMVEPFSNPQVVAHPIVVQLLERLLGADLRCSFYHSNTAYPGSSHQPIHRDGGPLFGTELGVPHPPVSIVLNIPLCDFTEQNGSTEVWPGSHLIVDSDPADAKALEQRVGSMASIRTNISAGDLVLRDMRAWHRGMPNNADYARSMLAIVYRRGWLHGATQTEIPQATWDAMSERARKIFRDNPIVEDTPDLAGVTIGDLSAQKRLRV